MPQQWFANKGQIVQITLASIAIIAAILLKTGLPSVPYWIVSGLIGSAIGVLVGAALQHFINRKRSTINLLKLVGTDFVADDRPETTYKRKLYITFRNESDTTVIVGPGTHWEPGDLRVNTVLDHRWAIEGPRGWRSNDWLSEEMAARIEPGKRVRTWVGLTNATNKTDVEHYVAEMRTGSLATSVAVANDVLLRV
jgi:hypothetical protein